MTRQLALGSLAIVDRTPPPEATLVVAYGGGVNTIASLVYLKRMGRVPKAIVMADPGSEWAHTVHYRDVILPPWLDANGFPRVAVATRIAEGIMRPQAWRLESLRDECLRLHALPSIAYGWKKCSQKYKAETQRWWIARQPWALAEWEAGRRIVKILGYDAGEAYRVRDAFQDSWEAKRLVPWYPLCDANLDRSDCEDLIRDEGLPVPGKSACTYCPSNTLAEWRLLRKLEPARFEEAVEMSRNAATHLEQPDVVGLMRCNPHGHRQLHEWADAGCPVVEGEVIRCFEGETLLGGDDAIVPCDCAL